MTPVRASLARPLIDSLKQDAIVHDYSIREIIPLRLKSFREAIQSARNEKVFRRKPGRLSKERSNQKINNRLLIMSLLAMAAIRIPHFTSLTEDLKTTTAYGLFLAYYGI